MAWLVLALVGPLSTAFLAVCSGWPDPRLHCQLPLKLALAVGLSLGLSSFTFFLWLLVAVGAAAFAGLEGQRRHGGWDARAIWNCRARFLFRAGDHWQDAFSPLLAWTHTDYPLLVPAGVARLWAYQGSDSPAAPATLAALFTFAIPVLLYGSLSELRSPWQGVLAAAAVLGTVSFLNIAARQYADVPLAFCYLAALVVLGLHDARPSASRGLLVLAGGMAGLSVWAKNEGWAFLAVLGVARAAHTLPRAGWKGLGRELAALLLGMAGPVTITLFFKLTLAPSNDLIAGQTWPGLLERLSDGSRYVDIAAAFGEELLGIGPWALVVLAAYGLLLGRAPASATGWVGFPALMLGLMGAAYFSVYVLTPRDLTWHLSTSLERVTHQLWPLMVFVWFLLIATPEEALRRQEDSPHPGQPSPQQPLHERR
jgi:hypothetical protein